MNAIALMGGALMMILAAPASSQALPDFSTAPETPPFAGTPTSSEGYRVADQDGFQIVEHGIWTPSQNTREVGSQPAKSAPAGKTDEIRSKRDSMAGTNFRRAAYLPWIYAAEARHSLPSGLLDALIWTESRYNPLAISPAGAAGLGQLMPGTARDMGVGNRFNPSESINGAARYLRLMLDRFGLVHLALAAYNAGPSAVERSRGIPANSETPSYVSQVLSRWSQAVF